MPIVYRTYGINKASVVLIPSICHERLVVYSANTTNTTGWAIRDFITNKILTDEKSSRRRADIEAEILAHYSEHPPFYNVTDLPHASRWELYLILRTIAYHGRNSSTYDTTDPVSNPGDTWEEIVPPIPWTPIVL